MRSKKRTFLSLTMLLIVMIAIIFSFIFRNQISVVITRIKDFLSSETYPVYRIGEYVYYNPIKGTTCSNYWTPYNNVNCYRFFVIEDSDTSNSQVKVMLDHDIGFASWTDRKTELNKLNWVDEKGQKLTPSIITKKQIYNILKIDTSKSPAKKTDGYSAISPDVKVSFTYINSFYFLNNKQYLNGKEKASPPGYWTNNSATDDSNYALCVTYTGNINYAKKTGSRGIRPVITLNKKIFSSKQASKTNIKLTNYANFGYVDKEYTYSNESILNGMIDTAPVKELSQALKDDKNKEKGKYTQLQGVTWAGDNLIFYSNKNEKAQGLLLSYNLNKSGTYSTEQVTAGIVTNGNKGLNYRKIVGGHGNDLTYDTKLKKILVVGPYKYNYVSLYNNDSDLSYSSVIKTPIAYTGITYDKFHDKYIGSYARRYYIVSKDFQQRLYSIDSIALGVTGGIEYHNGYLYTIVYQSTNSCTPGNAGYHKYSMYCYEPHATSDVIVYNAKLNQNGTPNVNFGKVVKVFHISDQIGEIESLSFKGNKLYLGYATRKTDNTYGYKFYTTSEATFKPKITQKPELSGNNIKITLSSKDEIKAPDGWTQSNTTTVTKTFSPTTKNPTVQVCDYYNNCTNVVVDIETPAAEYAKIVNSVTLNQTSLNMNAGSQFTLVATVSPTTALDKTITWSSTNAGVASVNNNGVVSAISNGVAVIKATSSNGKEAQCTVTVTTEPTGITLSQNQLTLNVEDVYNLTANVLPSTASNQTVNWTSSNQGVAMVDSTGKITALSKGTTTITASTSNNKTANCVVNVTDNATSIKLNYTDYTLERTNTFNLIATITPANITNKNIRWSTNNATIATVDQTGKVTGINNGTAIITATTENGNLSATCVVRVITKVKSLSIVPSELNMNVNDFQTLKVQITPTTATDKNVIWHSQDGNIATVSNTGIVRALQNGTTTITASTSDGSVTASVKVNVTTQVTKIAIPKKNYVLYVGDQANIEYQVLPTTASNKVINFTSSTPRIATVNEQGQITAVAPGNTTIKLTSHNNIEENVIVSVLNKPTNDETKKITFNKTNYQIKAGESQKVDYTLTGYTLEDINWSSSDEEVATVDNEGNILAKNNGTTIIKAISKDNKSKSECLVYVRKAVNKFTITGTYNLPKRAKQKMTFIMEPSDVTNKDIKWQSSDEQVAIINEEGIVTALSVGTTKITGTIEEDNISSSVQLTVSETPDRIEIVKTQDVLRLDENLTLTYKVYPENLEITNIKWSSNNDKIATIDSKGNIIAHDLGTVTITVEIEGTDISDSTEITIIESLNGPQPDDSETQPPEEDKPQNPITGYFARFIIILMFMLPLISIIRKVYKEKIFKI